MVLLKSMVNNFIGDLTRRGKTGTGGRLISSVFLDLTKKILHSLEVKEVFRVNVIYDSGIYHPIFWDV